MKGSVKWFDRKKGFGFIEGEDGQDYFVHHSAIKDGRFLKAEDVVNFDATDSEKGKQAQNVNLLEKASERLGAASAQKKAPASKKDDYQDEESDSEDSEDESDDDEQKASDDSKNESDDEESDEPGDEESEDDEDKK